MRETTVLIAFLFAFQILCPLITSALSPTVTQATCEYQETRNPVPINPKTNQPYTPDERNLEPFAGASISKDEIRQCLQAKTPIKNHHIVFEEYRDAWQELAKETGDYAIPLLIEGGVLHANTPYDREKNTGGIRLWEFRDPKIKDASIFTDEQQEVVGIEKKEKLTSIVRSDIIWEKIFINSEIVTSSENRDVSFFIVFNGKSVFSEVNFSSNVIFHKSYFNRVAFFDKALFRGYTDFMGSIFSEGADFNGSYFSKSKKASFYMSTFNKDVFFIDATFGRGDFARVAFRKVANFTRANFSRGADFRHASFDIEANFIHVNFNIETHFSEAEFNSLAAFYMSRFSGMTDFSKANFIGVSGFGMSIFDGSTNFTESIFSKEAVFMATFGGKTDFTRATFSRYANFRAATFSKEAYFIGTIFSREAFFSGAIFNGEARFIQAQFRDNADFRDATISGQLRFDNSIWEKRVDLRGMSAKELYWDSTNNPSNVKGVIDFRKAWIGSATIKEVRFQNLVDFSRTTLGQYREIIFGPPTEDQWEKRRQYLNLWKSTVYAWLNVPHNNSLIHFENNTFENEADFLHITVDAPVVFTNNRFRSTLDLTGATFAKQSPTAPLCLSYNRINRLVFESKHLGNVRRIDAPACQVNTVSNNPAVTAEQTAEPLPSIYKTLEKAFKDANDQRGVNEAWYQATVAQRDQMASGSEKTFWSIIWANISWLFGDIPSRYAVDVWRTVWVSIGIMLVFYFAYLLVLWRLARSSNPNHWTLYLSGHPERQRAFRLRLFEPIHSKDVLSKRVLIPWRDAALLSIRSYLKLGLGTQYPNTQPLTALMYVEWALGVFMLIHFILAMKNNLPFILPFLGTVN